MTSPPPGLMSLLTRWLTLGSRPYFILTFMVVAAFAPTLHEGIVNIDTPWLVADNPILNEGDPGAIGPILWDMTTGTRRTLGAEYLPLRDLSVLLDFALFGDNFLFHHGTNLLLYILGCLTFLRVCQGLFGPRPLAFLAAALFALHPLNVEPVAWLASRKDVLAFLFFNLGILAWLKGRSSVRWIFASVLLYLLAVWSKSPAIVLPGVLVVVSLIIKGDPLSGRWVKQWIPFAGVTATSMAIGMALGRQMSFFTPPLADTIFGRFVIACRLYTHYLIDALIPRGLGVYYVPPVSLPLSNPQSYLPLALILGLILTVLILWRRSPFIAGGLAWFMVALIPVSQLIPLQWVMADRYMLFPGMGLAIAAAALLSHLPKKGSAALGLAALVALGVTTNLQARHWGSSLKIWSQTVAVNPPSERLFASLAGAHLHEGDPQAALQVSLEGIQRFPDSARLHQVAGGIYLEMGDLTSAETYLLKAIGLDEDYQVPKAYNQMMIVHLRKDRPRDAAELGDRLVAHRKLYWQGWNTFGVSLLRIKAWPEAAQVLNQAILLAPHSADAQCNRALATYHLGRFGEAKRHWERCLALDPGNNDAKRGLEQLGKNPG